MKIIKTSSMIVSFIFIALAANFGLAKGSELTFTSVVTAVSQTDTNEGLVDVSIRGLDVPIIVNRDTEIELGGDEEGLSVISVGDIVKIRAFLSDQGVVADEIEIIAPHYQNFRLQGDITSVDSVLDSTRITVMGVDINVDSSTQISLRDSNDDSSLSRTDLQAGNEISVSGRLQNDELIASHIHVGSRLQGDIEFEGILTAVSSNSITVAIEGGVSTTALIDGNSSVYGDLVVGAFVEVEGQFNDELSIAVHEIVVDVDGDGDADDDNSGDDDGNNGGDNDNPEIGAEISLSGTTAVNGKAEVLLQNRDSFIKQKFEVEIEDAPVGVTYSILVFFGDQSVDFGTFTTNNLGEAEAEFEVDDDISDRELAPLLPGDLTVLDITAVQVLQEGSVVVEGQFNSQLLSNSEGADDSNDDDSNSGGINDETETSSEILLAGSGTSINGKAEVRLRNEDSLIDQKFEVEIEDAPVGVTYSILVFFGSQSVDFGTFTTNNLGEAEAEFEIDDDISDRPLAPLLPVDTTVLDITAVQILQNGSVVIEGSF